MNYQHDLVNLDVAIGNTDFRVMKCKQCGVEAKPYSNGQHNATHGYKVYCAACNAWIGWGGKSKSLKSESGERQISSQWSAKRLKPRFKSC